MIALPSLARLVARPPAAPHTRCELCGQPLAEIHRHVVERGTRGVHCACQACGILFSRGDRTAKLCTVPDRVVRGTCRLTAARLRTELGIPVTLAVYHRDSLRAAGIVCYPSPAGLIEAELAVSAWDVIHDATPLARELEDDVEALLIRGGRGDPALAVYLVPITAGYELVARLRTRWEGFAGGELIDHELAAFFAELDHRAQPP